MVLRAGDFPADVSRPRGSGPGSCNRLPRGRAILNVCIIPARGGSKRIPGKNIRPFAGRPIIAHAIDTARTCGLFDRIIVSTDDGMIAQVAREHGAETPFQRPARLADDYTGTNEVVGWVVRELLGSSANVSLVCCIYATAPLLRARYLREGRDALQVDGVDYAMAVTDFEFPIQRALRMGPDGRVRPFDDEAIRSRSQDLEPAVHDAGQFYWGMARAFAEEVPMYESNTVGIRLPRYLVQDIDTEEDWIRAEIHYETLKRMSLKDLS